MVCTAEVRTRLLGLCRWDEKLGKTRPVQGKYQGIALPGLPGLPRSTEGKLCFRPCSTRRKNLRGVTLTESFCHVPDCGVSGWYFRTRSAYFAWWADYQKIRLSPYNGARVPGIGNHERLVITEPVLRDK